MKYSSRSISLSALILAWALALSTSASGEIRKVVRFESEGSISYGILKGSAIHVVSGTPFDSEMSEIGKTLELDKVRLLPVSQPTHVLGVASNYRAPEDTGTEKPAFPQLFFKGPNAVIGPEETIEIPAELDHCVYEGEMVAVIGKRAKDVSVEDAPGYVAGITCGNDVSGTGWKDDTEWWRVKAADTFAPCGPVLATGLDYNDLKIELRLNGETKQSSRTSRMIFSTAEVVSFISRYITLEPGDLIYTGTQGPAKDLHDGDVVEVEIEGVGILRNRVKKLP